MIDYEQLAAKARAAQDAADQASLREKEVTIDPKVFFQRVTVQINEEMNKANVHLVKSGVGPIARNHLPNFDGIVFLVFGQGYLCRVELEAQPRVSKIKAIICGPPNGNELSRKEFLFGYESPGPHAERGAVRIVGDTPQEIAQEIISGIVLGSFD